MRKSLGENKIVSQNCHKLGESCPICGGEFAIRKGVGDRKRV